MLERLARRWSSEEDAALIRMVKDGATVDQTRGDCAALLLLSGITPESWKSRCPAD